MLPYICPCEFSHKCQLMNEKKESVLFIQVNFYNMTSQYSQLHVTVNEVMAQVTGKLCRKLIPFLPQYSIFAVSLCSNSMLG